MKQNQIKKSLKINWYFYLTLLICLWLLSKKFNKSLFNLIYSIIIISFIGWLVHWTSHKVNFTNFITKKNNSITRNKILNSILIKTCNFLDFHPTTHHDSEINNSCKNIIYEFINNIFTQGLFFIIILWFIKKVDIRICILWAFLYATIHNINYRIKSPKTHIQHHIDDQVNYGIDIWDIILNTKSDKIYIENHNHGAINLMCLTLLLIFLT